MNLKYTILNETNQSNRDHILQNSTYLHSEKKKKSKTIQRMIRALSGKRVSERLTIKGQHEKIWENFCLILIRVVVTTTPSMPLSKLIELYTKTKLTVYKFKNK